MPKILKISAIKIPSHTVLLKRVKYLKHCITICCALLNNYKLNNYKILELYNDTLCIPINILYIWVKIVRPI